MKQIKKTHALLSPSAASRWLICTPSARLEEKFPDTESEYAKEGTLAHRLIELLLKWEFDKIGKIVYKKELQKIQQSEFYNEEMLDHCEAFIHYVKEIYTEARDNFGKPIIYFEQNFNLSAYIEEGYGTTDVLILAGKHLIVFDFKYGKGVPVYAEDNPQLKLYGLGALLEFEHIFDIDQIDLIIYQPRIDNISKWSISKEDLLQWAETDLKRQAEKAYEGNGDFAAGSHCQFCKVRANCKAHYDNQIQLARHEFQDPELLEDETISEILDKIKLFEMWIAAVKEYALEQALKHGKKFPGYKLVEGRSSRKYADENEVLAQLKANGFKQKDLGSFKLKGITEMERMLGKRRFEALLNDYLIKPPGKPVLVPESDPRASVNNIEQAKIDFDDNLSDQLAKSIRLMH